MATQFLGKATCPIDVVVPVLPQLDVVSVPKCALSISKNGRLLNSIFGSGAILKGVKWISQMGFVAGLGKNAG